MKLVLNGRIYNTDTDDFSMWYRDKEKRSAVSVTYNRAMKAWYKVVMFNSDIDEDEITALTDDDVRQWIREHGESLYIKAA